LNLRTYRKNVQGLCQQESGVEGKLEGALRKRFPEGKVDLLEKANKNLGDME
jgi:hypothetical protein